MIHAVTTAFFIAVTVVLMLLTIAASAMVLIASFGLIGPLLALLVSALRGIGRLPRLTMRGCVQAGLRLTARLPGPRRWHRRVAAHRRSPQSTRLRLVRRRKVTPEVLQAVFVNNTTAEPVRIAVVRRCEEFGGAAQVMPTAVRPWGPAAYAWPLTYAEDAVVVHHALRRCLRFKDRNALRSGYARLARLAGPEAVWAMEYEHVGSLELMDPVVRSSMQAGDTDVLLEWLEEWA